MDREYLECSYSEEKERKKTYDQSIHIKDAQSEDARCPQISEFLKVKGQSTIKGWLTFET